MCLPVASLSELIHLDEIVSSHFLQRWWWWWCFFFSKKQKKMYDCFLVRFSLPTVMSFSSALLGHWVPGIEFEPGEEPMGPGEEAQESQRDRAGCLAQGPFREKHTSPAYNPGRTVELLPHSICHGQTCGCRLWGRMAILDIVRYFVRELSVITSI